MGGDAAASGGGSNPADVCPHVERPRLCNSMQDDGDVIAAEIENVIGLVVGGEKALRRRVGQCEFLAWLLELLHGWCGMIMTCGTAPQRLGHGTQ
jgi:hypothetical protein